MGEIYRLDFPNGKSYVGLTTKTAAERYKKHAVSAANGGTYPVLAAWRKHGAPALVVLQTGVPNEELAEAEVWAIARANTYIPNGYNVAYGGQMSPTLVPEVAARVRAIKSTPEARRAASEKGKEVASRREVKAKRAAYLAMPEVRQRLSEVGKRLMADPAHRKKLKDSAKPWSEESKRRLSETLRTPEVAAKISRLGWKHSEESKTKIGKSIKGKTRSAETRERMAEAARRRWAATPMSDAVRKKISETKRKNQERAS